MVVKELVSEQDMMRFLDEVYKKVLDGIPRVSPPVKTFAEDYLKKHKTKEEACKSMMQHQVIKCTTSGAVAGLGGVLTLPVALPANIANVLYVQMRMIACTAYMAGYELNSDQTQTFVYACLAGVAVNQMVKKVGIKIGEKVFKNIIKKIPKEVIYAINKKVGFRLLTKAGEKGAVNLGKLLPGVGAVIGGGFDFLETKIIANRAYKWFFENNLEINNDTEEDIIIQAEARLDD